MGRTLWVLKKALLPFDAKLVLYLIVEGAAEWLAKRRLKAGEEGSERSGRRRSGRSSSGGNEPRRVAVVLDGVSKKGQALVDRLVGLGYLVIFPNKENKRTDRTETIRGDMKREESVEAFIKRVQRGHTSLDLLVLNTQHFDRYSQSAKEISGMEKKIVPTRKKQGFITKKEQYREADRILLQKDPNIRRNYLINFLLVSGLSHLLKLGQARVVICTTRVFRLVSEENTGTLLPSMFYSFCYSQMCKYLLGLGAKTRFPYLDIRVVSTSCAISDLFSGNFFKAPGMARFALDSDQHAAAVINAVTAEKQLAAPAVFDGFTRQEAETSPRTKDRANDLWEQAEMIS